MITTTYSQDVQRRDAPRLLFFLVLLLLVFVPLFRAGNRPLPLMITELMALAIMVLCWMRYQGLGYLPLSTRVGLLLLLFMPLIYLIPIPYDWWAALPGREMYGQSLGLLGMDKGYHLLSVLPANTEAAWLALLPPLAVFVAVSALAVRQVKYLVLTFLVIAFLEAALGLMQMGAGPDSALRLGNPFYSRNAVGTYINRNHLAGLLEMALPLALAMLAATMGKSRDRFSYLSNMKTRVVEFVTYSSQHAVLYAGFSLVILLGLVFTLSRSGVALAILAVLLSIIAFARRLGGSNVFGLLGTLSAVGVGVAVMIGLAPVLGRFASDPLADLRWEIYDRTLQGIGTFFPLGSGPGTYGFLFPHMQGNKIEGFVQNAHNDYLEWLFEGGVLAAVVVLWLLVLYIRRWPRLWVADTWTSFRFMQVGAGIGILLMLLHSLTDFNLHIPANAAYFALLAAVFLHEGSEDVRQQSGAGQDHAPLTSAHASPLSTVDPAKLPRNPFLDPPRNPQ